MLHTLFFCRIFFANDVWKLSHVFAMFWEEVVNIVWVVTGFEVSRGLSLRDVKCRFFIFISLFDNCGVEKSQKSLTVTFTFKIFTIYLAKAVPNGHCVTMEVRGIVINNISVEFQKKENQPVYENRNPSVLLNLFCQKRWELQGGATSRNSSGNFQN